MVATRLGNHVLDHPGRLFVSLILALFLSFSFTGYAIFQGFKITHDTAIINCQNNNELRLELYSLFTDLDVPLHLRERLLDLTDCEKLP